MKVTDLKTNEAILCITSEECLAVEKLCHEAGLKWNYGQSYSTTSYSDMYLGNHCYDPINGQHGNKSYYEEQGYQIYHASLFLGDSKYEIF